MGPEPVRFWGDQLPPNSEAMVKEKWTQIRAERPHLMARGRRPVVNFLAQQLGLQRGPILAYNSAQQG